MEQKKNQIIRQENFLTEWKISSPNLIKIKSIPDVFNSGAPCLSLIKKDYGNDFMLTYIALWVSGISSFSGGKLTDDDCLNIASIIFDDFYFLNIADLKLITKRLNKRKFIRVSGNEIYNEIELYFNDRCKEAQIHSKNASDSHKNDLHKPILDNDKLIDLYKSVKAGENLSEPKEERQRSSDKNREAHDKSLEYYRQYRKDNPNNL